MRKFIAVIIFVLGAVPEPASAEPVRLHCISEGKSVRIVIDIDAGHIQLGSAFTYKIHRVTDKYITAKRIKSKVGGEIMVINRFTGDYKRSSVSVPLSEVSDKLSNIINTNIFSGNCKSKIF